MAESTKVWTYYQIDACEDDILRDMAGDATGFDLMPRRAWRSAEGAKAAAEAAHRLDWDDYRANTATGPEEEYKPLEWASYREEEAAESGDGGEFVVYAIEIEEG